MTLELLAAGLAVGLAYAAIGAAVAVSFVATRTLHLAVGTVAAAGVTVTLSVGVTAVTGVPPWLAVLLGMLAGAALSSGTYLVAVTRRDDPTTVLVGFVVAAALLDAALATFGRGRTVRPDPLVSPDTIAPEVLAAAGGLVIAVALQTALQHTRVGRRLRIVGASPSAAERLGFGVTRLRLAAFAVAGAAATLAAVLVAPVVAFGPAQAAGLTVRGLAAAVLVRGRPSTAIVGGLVLGLAEVTAQRAWPAAGGDLAITLVVVGVLAARGATSSTGWGRAW